jgi:hypothetical protein
MSTAISLSRRSPSLAALIPQMIVLRSEGLSYETIAARLGVSLDTVYRHAKDGVRLKPGRKPCFPVRPKVDPAAKVKVNEKAFLAADEAYLREHYPSDTRVGVIADHLGRSLDSIRLKANKMGLRRPSRKPHPKFAWPAPIFIKQPEDLIRDAITTYIAADSAVIGLSRSHPDYSRKRSAADFHRDEAARLIRRSSGPGAASKVIECGGWIWRVDATNELCRIPAVMPSRLRTRKAVDR